MFTTEIKTKEISTMDLMGTVASYEFETEMETDMGGEIIVIEGIDIEVEATREPEKQISMKEEMISLDDLDTGQFKAMIIQDPTNKQDIRGFIYIATAWGTQLRPPDNLKLRFPRFLFWIFLRQKSKFPRCRLARKKAKVSRV